MPKFKVELSDTVTYARSKIVEIEAADEAEAEDKVIELACNGPAEFFDNFREDQVANTPWEAMVIK